MVWDSPRLPGRLFRGGTPTAQWRFTLRYYIDITITTEP
jgi:hypothetical protein